MLKRITLALFVVYLIIENVSAAEPWEPEPRDLPLHHTYVEETKKLGRDIRIIFYGDSITRGWAGNGKDTWDKYFEPLRAVNYGIDGDRTQHIIWRIENGEVENLDPSVVVLKIGTNNLSAGNKPEDIAKGIKAIIDLLRHKLPRTNILLLGVLPRGHGELEAQIKEINSLISNYTIGDTIDFMDLHQQFADKNGSVNTQLFTPDLLHLVKAGYDEWAKAIYVKVRRMAYIESPLPWEPTRYTPGQDSKFIEETKSMGKEIQVIFYGDSITAQWADGGKDVWVKHYANLHAVNYGVGGDRIQHLLARIGPEVEGLSPKVVVLKIGTNNLYIPETNDDDLAHGIKAIIDLLHQKLPQTKILLLGILPRGKIGQQYTERVMHINSLIAKFANGNTIQFLDMYSHYADAHGHIKKELYIADGIHLTKAGYEVWAETMDPLLHKMLGI